MVLKCKEHPAKDRKEDKNTNNLIYGEDTIGRRGVQTKGLIKFRVREEHARGSNVGVHSTGRCMQRGFREKVALTSATVLVFIQNHVPSTALCRAIPR